MSPTRQALFERLAPIWILDDRGPVLDLDEVFRRHAGVVLDIGFGGGDALRAMALAQL